MSEECQVGHPDVGLPVDGAAVGDPLPVGAPGRCARRAVDCEQRLGRATGGGNSPEAVRPAAVGRDRHPRAVGRPGRVDVVTGPAREQPLVGAVGAHHEHVGPAGRPALPRDASPVGRPGGVPVVDPRSRGQPLHLAGRGVGDVDLAAARACAGEGDAIPVGRDGDIPVPGQQPRQLAAPGPVGQRRGCSLQPAGDDDRTKRIRPTRLARRRRPGGNDVCSKDKPGDSQETRKRHEHTLPTSAAGKRRANARPLDQRRGSPGEPPGSPASGTGRRQGALRRGGDPRERIPTLRGNAGERIRTSEG